MGELLLREFSLWTRILPWLSQRYPVSQRYTITKYVFTNTKCFTKVFVTTWFCYCWYSRSPINHNYYNMWKTDIINRDSITRLRKCYFDLISKRRLSPASSWVLFVFEAQLVEESHCTPMIPLRHPLRVPRFSQYRWASFAESSLWKHDDTVLAFHNDNWFTKVYYH